MMVGPKPVLAEERAHSALERRVYNTDTDEVNVVEGSPSPWNQSGLGVWRFAY